MLSKADADEGRSWYWDVHHQELQIRREGERGVGGWEGVEMGWMQVVPMPTPLEPRHLQECLAWWALSVWHGFCFRGATYCRGWILLL